MNHETEVRQLLRSINESVTKPANPLRGIGWLLVGILATQTATLVTLMVK